MSSPLVFRGIRVFLGIRPPDEVLPVDGDRRESPLGDEPVEVGPRHSRDGGGGANADVFVRVDFLCHDPTVADRIPMGNRPCLVREASVYRGSTPLR